jgi:hypothetical protein
MTMPATCLRRLLILLFAAGCGAAGADPYPSDWPSLQTGLFTGLRRGGCPDLTGTYALDPKATPPFVTKPDQMAERWPFETLTISGDVQKSLTLRFTRSAATLLRWEASLSEAERAHVAKLNSREHRHSPEFNFPDANYRDYISSWVLQPVVLQILSHDDNYECNNGWLKQHYTAVKHRRRGSPDYALDRSRALIRRDNRLTGFGVPAPWVGQIPVITGSDPAWTRFISSEPAFSGTAPTPWAAGATPVEIRN